MILELRSTFSRWAVECDRPSVSLDCGLLRWGDVDLGEVVGDR
jgi:hypothetical protein